MIYNLGKCLQLCAVAIYIRRVHYAIMVCYARRDGKMNARRWFVMYVERNIKIVTNITLSNIMVNCFHLNSVSTFL